MNVKRDPDAILAAWLEDGPTVLPEQTRRAIAVTTRTTTQRRHPLWVPRGRPLMNTYARWAVAAIAVVLAIGGAYYFLAPAGGQVGGPPNADTISLGDPRRRVLPSSPATASSTPGPTFQPSTRADVHHRSRGRAQLRTRFHVPRRRSLSIFLAGSASNSDGPGSR